MDPPSLPLHMLSAASTPTSFVRRLFYVPNFQTSAIRESKKFRKILVAMKTGVKVVVDGCKSDFILF